MGCKSISSFPTRSSFVEKSDILIGMPIDEFVSLYGEPYKKSFFYAEDSAFHQKLYYKEQIYNRVFYTINSIFEFRESKLIYQNQEMEKRLYDNCDCSN